VCSSDLEEIPDEVDLKVATRIYIEAISRVHVSIRKMADEPLGKARALIEDARTLYQKSYAGRIVGLNAMCLDYDRIVEKVPLLLEWDDIRLKLVRRNSELLNLRNRHVSGEVKAREE